MRSDIAQGDGTFIQYWKPRKRHLLTGKPFRVPPPPPPPESVVSNSNPTLSNAESERPLGSGPICSRLPHSLQPPKTSIFLPAHQSHGGQWGRGPTGPECPPQDRPASVHGIRPGCWPPAPADGGDPELAPPAGCRQPPPSSCVASGDPARSPVTRQSAARPPPARPVGRVSSPRPGSQGRPEPAHAGTLKHAFTTS